ncbi:MAG TPA: hypothetical protein IAB57_04720 [Candidatus Fimivivens faecavium]|nr:hypothetical protein [Candidatus Fimivivens faecavium]
MKAKTAELWDQGADQASNIPRQTGVWFSPDRISSICAVDKLVTDCVQYHWQPDENRLKKRWFANREIPE